MSAVITKPASTARVVLAFITVYLVWGSTYFFIRMSVGEIPPMLVGALRFVLAGGVMLLWCLYRGEKVFDPSAIRPAAVSGLLLLFLGNGSLIWCEQYLPSSLAAILLAAAPIWFVLFDRRMWAQNFRSKATITGLVVGFGGVLLLFGEPLLHSFNKVGVGHEAGAVAVAAPGGSMYILAMVILVLGSFSWVSGSLYSKYKTSGASNAVNACWQMLAAGIAFIPASWLRGEWAHFHPQEVTMKAWLSVFYLVTMGSLVGYSAFVWLLSVRPVTQVSTYAYVNPVVAVLLGFLFAGEDITNFQILGLSVILLSVLLINLAKYRSSAPVRSGVSGNTTTQGNAEPGMKSKGGGMPASGVRRNRQTA